MDFTGIGKIGTYVRQKNLIFAANYKIKTGQRIVDDTGRLNFTRASMFDQISAAQKKSAKTVNKAKLANIKQKLMSGRKLTSEEMGYLRENDPKTYKKAKYAEEAREELKAALRRAKTKQEARQAVTQAIVKIAAEATEELAALKNGAGGGGGGGMNLGADLNANVDTNATDLNANVDMNAADLNVDGEGLVSANEDISADFQAATSEISTATTDTLNETGTSTETHATSDNDDEEWTAQDVIDKFIMAIRAIQDEWKHFTDSKEFDDLPEDPLEEAEFQVLGKKRRLVDVPDQKVLDAVAAYQAMMSAGAAK